MHFFCDVAEPALRAQFDFEIDFAAHIADVLLRIQYLDLPRKLEVRCGYFLRTFH